MEFLLLALLGGIYFLPSIIASANNHKKAGPIVVVNFFLGWTLLGWVISLAWSLDFQSHQKDGEYGDPAEPSSNRQEETINDELFGRYEALYRQLRKFLSSLGPDVREFTNIETYRTFEVDFGNPVDPGRASAQNGFVQIHPRPNYLMLWVRIEPTLPQIPSGLSTKNRRRTGGGRFPLQIHLANNTDLEKAKPLLHQAYARKKAEGHNNQPKL